MMKGLQGAQAMVTWRGKGGQGGSELGAVLEVAQESNEQREGVKHSTMQTVSQIIT